MRTTAHQLHSAAALLVALPALGCTDGESLPVVECQAGRPVPVAEFVAADWQSDSGGLCGPRLTASGQLPGHVRPPVPAGRWMSVSQELGFMAFERTELGDACTEAQAVSAVLESGGKRWQAYSCGSRLELVSEDCVRTTVLNLSLPPDELFLLKHPCRDEPSVMISSPFGLHYLDVVGGPVRNLDGSSFVQTTPSAGLITARVVPELRSETKVWRQECSGLTDTTAFACGGFSQVVQLPPGHSEWLYSCQNDGLLRSFEAQADGFPRFNGRVEWEVKLRVGPMSALEHQDEVYVAVTSISGFTLARGLPGGQPKLRTMVLGTEAAAPSLVATGTTVSVVTPIDGVFTRKRFQDLAGEPRTSLWPLPNDVRSLNGWSGETELAVLTVDGSVGRLEATEKGFGHLRFEPSDETGTAVLFGDFVTVGQESKLLLQDDVLNVYGPGDGLQSSVPIAHEVSRLVAWRDEPELTVVALGEGLSIVEWDAERTAKTTVLRSTRTVDAEVQVVDGRRLLFTMSDRGVVNEWTRSADQRAWVSTATTTGARYGAQYLAVGDINRDGFLDIVTANTVSAARIWGSADGYSEREPTLLEVEVIDADSIMLQPPYRTVEELLEVSDIALVDFEAGAELELVIGTKGVGTQGFGGPHRGSLWHFATGEPWESGILSAVDLPGAQTSIPMLKLGGRLYSASRALQETSSLCQ